MFVGGGGDIRTYYMTTHYLCMVFSDLDLGGVGQPTKKKKEKQVNSDGETITDSEDEDSSDEGSSEAGGSEVSLEYLPFEHRNPPAWLQWWLQNFFYFRVGSL